MVVFVDGFPATTPPPFSQALAPLPVLHSRPLPTRSRSPHLQKRHHRAPIASSTLQRNKLLRSLDKLRASQSLPALAPASFRLPETSHVETNRTDTRSFLSPSSMPKMLDSLPKPPKPAPAPDAVQQPQDPEPDSTAGIVQRSPERPKTAREKARDVTKRDLMHSVDNYVELTFEADTSGYRFSANHKTAAGEFDKRHRHLMSAARRRLIALSYRPTDQRAVYEALNAVRLHRFVVDDTPVKEDIFRFNRKKKSPRFRLSESCWAERGAFFETDDVLRPMFEHDWWIASRSHYLNVFIVQKCRDPKAWRDIDRDGSHDEVDEVRDALFRHVRMVYGAFDYYAALSSELDPSGEPDVFNISFDAFMQFVDRCRMTSESCPRHVFKSILALVDKKDYKTDSDDKFNASKSLNRQEFMQAVVRSAIAIWMETSGTTNDPSEAINTFLVENLLSNLPAEALQNRDKFRKNHCYMQRTSEVLQKHANTLRAVFEFYAASDQDANELRDDERMSIGEWLVLIAHLGLVESAQTTLQDAKLIFLASRIRKMDDSSTESENRLRHLDYVGFLEAFTRLSLQCALPTDTEIAEVGAKDAGEFLISMQRLEPRIYKRFCETHKPDQNGSPKGGRLTAQPVERCVEHLLMLVIRTIESHTSAKDDLSKGDGEVQFNEAKRFFKLRSKGDALDHTLTSQRLRGINFYAALETSQTKMIVQAAALKIQMSFRIRVARKSLNAKRLAAEEAARAAAEAEKSAAEQESAAK